jgi:transcriptional regulator with XRE-family HTH domain
MFSPALLLAARKGKGFSQEVLAERSGVSLRTIQRVEQGDTVPRGHTVQALAEALGLSLEALRMPDVPSAASSPSTASVLRTDPNVLQLLNLSALCFLVLPLLNLLVPWLVWRARRHDTAHVAEVGRRVLGFQILWQVGSFFFFLLLVIVQLVAARAYQVVLPGLFIGGLVFLYALNALTVGYYALRLRAGHLNLYRFHL